MTISRQDLAAYADGELDEARREEVRTAVEADPALAAVVAAHLKLKRTLYAHFGPVADAPVPDRFVDLLRQRERASVADFAAGREQRQVRCRLPGVRWGWIVGPALAASLALAVFVPSGGEAPAGYAGAQLATVLDRQLVAEQPADAGTRILLSFRDNEGRYCRAFNGKVQSGIACRDDEGWHLRVTAESAVMQQGDYRMAGGNAADILAEAQDMASGPALTAEEEAAARKQGWR